MADLDAQRSQYSQSLYDLFEAIQSVDGGGTYSPTRFDLIGLVKIKIDEYQPEGEGVEFEVTDTTNTTDTLDVTINSFLDSSAKFLYQTAPLTYIDGVLCDTTPVINSNLSGYVVLPSAFIRLQSFKMSVWEQSVSGEEVITPDSPKYKRQSSYGRGGRAKPVCAIALKNVDGVIKRVLEFYSLGSTDMVVSVANATTTFDVDLPINTIVRNIDTGVYSFTTATVASTLTLTTGAASFTTAAEHFIYVPVVVAESVQTNLWNSLTWICAAKVLAVTGRKKASEDAFNQVLLSYKNLM